MHIGCKEKTIFISTEVATPHEVISTLLKGIICMIHYLFGQNKVFLLILTTDADEGKVISFGPVVIKFQDVFLKDVSSLPAGREVVYSIDLVPGTLSVSITPYKMSLVELKELNTQL